MSIHVRAAKTLLRTAKKILVTAKFKSWIHVTYLGYDKKLEDRLKHIAGDEAMFGGSGMRGTQRYVSFGYRSPKFAKRLLKHFHKVTGVPGYKAVVSEKSDIQEVEQQYVPKMKKFTEEADQR